MADLFTAGQIHLNLDKVVTWSFSEGEFLHDDSALIVEFDHEIESSHNSQGRRRWYYRNEYGDDIDIAYAKLAEENEGE